MNEQGRAKLHTPQLLTFFLKKITIMKKVLSTVLALSLLTPTMLLVCESNDSNNPLLPQIIGALYCFALYLFVTLTKFGSYLWSCFNSFVDYLNKLDKPFKK